MLENPRKFENSPNLLLLFVKITKCLEFSKKITIKTIAFRTLAHPTFPNPAVWQTAIFLVTQKIWVSV